MTDPFVSGPRPVASRSQLRATISGEPVTIAGIDIPFWDMVVFMVKWSIAAIPAAIILLLFGVAAAMFLIPFYAAVMSQ